MNVICRHCPSYDHHFPCLADLPQQIARTLCHPPPQNLVPIFRDPHKVILDIENRVRTRTILDHPHILALYDYGESRVNEATLTYMVMPYRPEGTLTSWLQRRGRAEPLSPQEVASLIDQAASALQHAHNRQIIHQDVKPANFLIQSDEENPSRLNLQLADFGVAKFNSATASASQAVRGTPASMAPEQWEGHPVPATDQYALAVMAYELLAGRPPFQGGLSQVMFQHFNTPPPAPST